MKQQFFIVIDIFKLSSSRQNLLREYAFYKNCIPQVAPVHFSPDGSAFKGLQNKLTNNIRTLLSYYGWQYN